MRGKEKKEAATEKELSKKTTVGLNQDEATATTERKKQLQNVMKETMKKVGTANASVKGTSLPHCTMRWGLAAPYACILRTRCAYRRNSALFIPKTPFVSVFASLHPGVRSLHIPCALFALPLIQMTLSHVPADCFLI